MRSGDIHKNTQHDFIFSGQVLVWILDKNGTTQKKLYGQHQYIEIPPFTPHIFEFLQDSVIAEWWTPQGFYAWFYKPYRTLVQKSFQTTQPGRFIILHQDQNQQDHHHNHTHGNKLVSYLSSTIIYTSLTTIALGLAIGYWLGKKHA